MKRASIKRRRRFPGIIADAAALGVHRTSLYKVLSGERSGKNLMARYTALKAAQSAVARPNKTKRKQTPLPTMTHTALLEENSHLLDALNKAQEKALAIRADQKIDNAELHEINAAIGHVKERIAYLKAHPAGDTINQDNSPK